MKLKKGTEVYIKVTIIRQALDTNCPKEERGYEFRTKRGGLYVNFEDILVSLDKLREVK